MSREPVTGNEIPPGSLASEVRDDIPAQLSEGEYIVPADVLRYYGVRFFEDLRAQAKQGMMDMESDGRIGGAPVDAQGVPIESQDEELTPEEEQMLMEALGGSEAAPAGGARTAPARMAYGGMVEQPMTTPYQDQATMYQMPAGMGGSMGMQEGGVVEEPFDRTKFTLDDNTSSGLETKRYINPTTKEERTVNFLNGMPLGVIPEGFVPWSQELAGQPKPTIETGTSAKVAEVKVERGEGPGAERGQPTTGEGSMGWAEKNFDAVTSDPLGFAQGVFSDANQPKNFVGEVFGKTGLGKIANDVSTLSAISELEAAKAQTKPGSTAANTIDGYINALSNSLDTNVAETMYSLGVVATGTQYTNQIDKLKGTGVTTTSSAPPGAPVAGGVSTSTPTSTGGYSRPGGRDQQGSTGTPTGTSTSDRPGGRDQQGSTGTPTGGGTPGGGFGTGGPGNVGTSGGISASGTASGGAGVGTSGGGKSSGGGLSGGANENRRATGGLVSKRTTPKKPKKGLAS
jgi:hypothetical protein